MEIRMVRAAIAKGFKESGETQEVFAKRAGVNQGQFAKVIDLSKDITEIRARTIFSLVERGLGLTLSSFFASLESGGTGHDNRMAVVRVPSNDPPLQLVSEDVPGLQEELGHILARYIHAIARQQAPSARPARSRRGKGHRADR